MIKNRDIVFFADDWGRFPSTMQHIGKVLAQNNRVIWVGSLGLRKPKFNLSDLKRVVEKLKGYTQKSVPAENEKVPVIVVNPFVLPFHDSFVIRQINKVLLTGKLKKAIENNGFKNFIIITSSPVMQSIVGRLGEKSAYYFCLDDYTLFDGAFKSLRMLETKLLKKVNAAFSVSEGLRTTRIPESGKSYFLPQGVELSHFREIKNVPDKTTLGLKGKVIGFFGLLSEWINITLFVKAAKKYPDYSFLIIGRATVNITIFGECPNIKYIGPVQYSVLPGYAALFDVGLVPFIVNDLKIAANPLKMLEYMSLGMPVVSTDLPEVRKFEDYIYVAKNDEEFINMIGLAVSRDNDSLKGERMKKADSYSWEAIADSISEKILLSEK